MSTEDRQHWESKYADPSEPASARASMGWLPPARDGQIALDIASGRGRHALALCELGYRVVAVDIALGALRTPALAERGLIHPVQADLDCWPFAPDSFDVIVQYDFLDRALFGEMRKSLRPQGLLLIDTFRIPDDPPDRFGPSNPEFRLESGELERCFGDWEILELTEQAAGPDQAARAAILVRRSG